MDEESGPITEHRDSASSPFLRAEIWAAGEGLCSARGSIRAWSVTQRGLLGPAEVPSAFFFFLTFGFVCLFVCLFMAVLALHFCARAFSSCGKWGPLFTAVRGPLTVVASLVAEHRLQTRRHSSCGAQA